MKRKKETCVSEKDNCWRIAQHQIEVGLHHIPTLNALISMWIDEFLIWNNSKDNDDHDLDGDEDNDDYDDDEVNHDNHDDDDADDWPSGDDLPMKSSNRINDAINDDDEDDDDADDEIDAV